METGALLVSRPALKLVWGDMEWLAGDWGCAGREEGLGGREASWVDAEAAEVRSCCWLGCGGAWGWLGAEDGTTACWTGWAFGVAGRLGSRAGVAGREPC